MREEIITIIKAIIDLYENVDCGIYNTRNIVGDNMTNIYSDFKNGVVVDVCYPYGYFEIFGLDKEEWSEIKRYYDSKR